jgi:HSP20 family molecular chaperone IbpA
MEPAKFRPKVFERRVDDLMRELIGDKGRARWPFKFDGGDWFVPAADVFNRKGDLIVRISVPGIDPEKDVEIILGSGRLIVRGKRMTSEKNYLRLESSYGTFGRSIPIPKETSEKDVAAFYKDGVLEVVVKGAAVDMEGSQANKKIAIKPS